MQSTNHTITGFGFIILNKRRFADLFFKLSLIERFEKVTTLIFKKTWLDNDYAFYGSLYYIHNLIGKVYDLKEKYKGVHFCVTRMYIITLQKCTLLLYKNVHFYIG